MWFVTVGWFGVAAIGTSQIWHANNQFTKYDALLQIKLPNRMHIEYLILWVYLSRTYFRVFLYSIRYPRVIKGTIKSQLKKHRLYLDTSQLSSDLNSNGADWNYVDSPYKISKIIKSKCKIMHFSTPDIRLSSCLHPLFFSNNNTAQTWEHNLWIIYCLEAPRIFSSIAHGGK